MTLPEQVAQVVTRLSKDPIAWRDQLRQNPSRFGDVEIAVHHAFQQMADQVVAGLLADVGVARQLEDDAKKSG